MTKQTFVITNLTCGACVKLSVMALEAIPGVLDCSVDLESGKTEITASRAIERVEIIQALNEVGKTVDILE